MTAKRLDEDVSGNLLADFCTAKAGPPGLLNHEALKLSL